LLRPIMKMVLLAQGVKASGAFEYGGLGCGFGEGYDDYGYDQGYGAQVSLDDSVFYGDACRDRYAYDAAERYAPIQQEISAGIIQGALSAAASAEYTAPNYSESTQYNAPNYEAPCPPPYQAPIYQTPVYQTPVYQTPTHGQTQYFPETYAEIPQQQATNPGISTLYYGGAQGASQPGYVAPCPPPAQAAASQYSPGFQSPCYTHPVSGQAGQTPSSGQVSVLMNGEIPVGLTPQSLTVGTVTYSLPQTNPSMGAAAGMQNVSISPLHTPEEIAAGLAGSGLSAEEIAAMEKVAGGAATNATGNATNATKKGSKKKGKKGQKGGARKGVAKKKNGAAGIPLLITFVVIPLALLLM